MNTTSVAVIDPLALRTMTTEELRDLLAQGLEVTARHLVGIAAVWRELESRGQDLSGLRSGLWAYMGLIASGRLLPELVVRYAGHSMLLRGLSDLDPQEQLQLLKDDTVVLVEVEGDTFSERRVPVAHLKAQQIRQVIGSRIRTPVEQRRTALSLSRRSTPPHRPAGQDGDAGAPNAAEPHAFAIARRLKRRRSGEAGELKAIAVRLDPDEAAVLERAAVAAGVTVPALLRAALMHAGLLEEPK